MRDDKELVESFLGPIRECAEYRRLSGIPILPGWISKGSWIYTAAIPSMLG